MPAEVSPIRYSISHDCYLKIFQDECTKFCDNVLNERMFHDILWILFINRVQWFEVLQQLNELKSSQMISHVNMYVNMK
jgi:hypothetical protein